MDDAWLVCMGCMDSHQFALNSYKSVHATLDKVTLTLTYDFGLTSLGFTLYGGAIAF